MGRKHLRQHRAQCASNCSENLFPAKCSLRESRARNPPKGENSPRPKWRCRFHRRCAGTPRDEEERRTYTSPGSEKPTKARNTSGPPIQSGNLGGRPVQYQRGFGVSQRGKERVAGGRGVERPPGQTSCSQAGRCGSQEGCGRVACARACAAAHGRRTRACTAVCPCAAACGASASTASTTTACTSGRQSAGRCRAPARRNR